MDDNRCLSCPTRRLCLAADLEQAAAARLAECLRMIAPLHHGDVLYRAGDAASSCFVVRSGSFKTCVESADGHMHVTGFHFPGDLMGVAGQAEGVHCDTAVALETSTACRLALEEMPTIWQLGSGAALLRLVGRSEREAAQHQMNLSRPAADARVAGFLVSLGRRMKRGGRSAISLPLPMSRTDLANHLGMTLECLSRVMNRMSRAGFITATRSQVVQHRPAELEALAAHVDR